MIDDGDGAIHDAAGIIEADGQQSSHAIETCSGEASQDDLRDDPRPWTDPVGCAKIWKSSENQQLGDALRPNCRPTVSPTTVSEDLQRQSNGLRAFTS